MGMGDAVLIYGNKALIYASKVMVYGNKAILQIIFLGSRPATPDFGIKEDGGSITTISRIQITVTLRHLDKLNVKFQGYSAAIVGNHSKAQT